MLNTLILAQADEGGGGALVSLVPFLLIGLVFYFLIIRPQRKRQSDQQKLLRSLSVGDEVITIGGFHGEIIHMTDDLVELEIARDVIVTVARSAVARTLTEAPPMDDAILGEDNTFDDADFDDAALDDPAFDDAGLDDAAFDDADAVDGDDDSDLR
ncbi:hypothetical protein BH23ACT9_BH23ACT9_35080 [soil metagenome]